jgi:hypothetical protein
MMVSTSEKGHARHQTRYRWTGGLSLPGLEDIPEVGRAGTEPAVDHHIAVEIEFREDLVEIGVCGFDRNCIGGDRDTVELLGRTPVEKDVDRAGSSCRRRTSGGILRQLLHPGRYCGEGPPRTLQGRSCRAPG